MSNTTEQSFLEVVGTDALHRPEDHERLFERIHDLAAQQYMVVWMQLEIAAIASLLKEGAITAADLWRLVQTHYNIAPSVMPDFENDSGWLTQPLANAGLVWEHLTTLCAGQELKPVPALPQVYDDETSETLTLRDQALNFYAAGLNRLWERFSPEAEDFLDRLAHDPRHVIEHHLAVQWLGGPFAVGATLYGDRLVGGSFGYRESQPVYVLKAFVGALKRDIADYQESRSADADSAQVGEILGRVYFWATIVKGYVYNMVHAYQGVSVIAMLVEHPALVEDLRAVLLQAPELLNPNSDLLVPNWSMGRTDSDLNHRIRMMPVAELVELLDKRLASQPAPGTLHTRL